MLWAPNHENWISVHCHGTRPYDPINLTQRGDPKEEIPTGKSKRKNPKKEIPKRTSKTGNPKRGNPKGEIQKRKSKRKNKKKETQKEIQKKVQKEIKEIQKQKDGLHFPSHWNGTNQKTQA